MKYCLFLLIGILLLQGCSMTLSVKDGRTAYDLKQYSRAIEMLLEEYEDEKKAVRKDDIAYLLGKAYDKIGDFENSLSWMRKSGGERHSLEALRDLGYAYKKNGQYLSARKCFKDLLDKAPSDPRFTQEVYVLKRLIEDSDNQDEAYRVSLHPSSSPFNDFAPVIFDDNHIIITSDRDGGTSDDTYLWTGQSFSDFYLMTTRGIPSSGSFVAMINTEHNEGTGCFNSDFTEFYFTRCSGEKTDHYCRIYSMQYVDDAWSEPVMLPFQIEESNYGHPALIEGDDVLVFSSDAEGARGGRDLFFSERLYTSDSTSYEWSEASLLPQTINTERDEVFPVGYNDTLYFSSDGLAGMGGLDIFKTYLTAGRWAVPQAIEAPINSEADDMSFIIDPNRSSSSYSGYFASNREGLGGDDIYRFDPRIETEEPVDDIPKDDVVVEAEEVSYYLAVQVVEPRYAIADDPNSDISGYDPLPDTELRILADETLINGTTDKSGRWIKELAESKTIRIGARKDGYFEAEKVEDIVLQENGETVNIRIVLNPIILNTEITLENILYDFNKWDIREDAKPSLDSLSRIMKLNKRIDILLSSHTDCRGEEEYNLILSQKRAQSAVDYLIKSGVSRLRVKAKGFGESAPLVTCVCETCTEEEHQRNRRTAFSIVNIR